ncbi:MAG: imidazole glycerol phosphate synthase subunit HisF [Methanobacteriaceae archaeon]|jgi:cyclase|nr:imidazole glycerol phosphate synthase subunit HisF [Methanobacteriaceae archaeon]MDP2836208.1 imidazole glycerol phosphate synthase subunit HisF [Methanobacteriaceae archaeon]MDP3033655.1 imidazole glycerol phosphate synthase subunit HisF [Methanobacteriaceae archaeon]MDP3484693.1 imidazole glycerol phosphate synthase subunit HisF [Methanobacteriaceae archaeon]MDP3624670.1 imidazole glycerol phosphate synthase subunit HisF [Methanobacteriaceae archaeon]
MLAKRIIPCLDCDLQVPHGRVVKGVEFKQIRYAGEPVELATKYYEDGADEIVFLDITASHERRETMADVIKATTENVFVPICVGGGIRKPEDYVNMLKAGADKCSTNTAAIHNPDLISEASKIVGSQACVIGIDAKRRYIEDENEAQDKIIVETKKGLAWFDCSIYGGREFTGMDAIAWAMECEDRGAGEILLTSMDRDGTKDGYDLELTRAISESVDIPVIASGGVGTPQHVLEAFTLGKADAALAASIFHFNEYPVPEVKAFLKDNGVVVRE